MDASMRTAAHRGGERSLVVGVLAAFVTVAGWTTWIVGTRHAVASPGGFRFDPVSLAMLRFGFAALVFAPWWLKTGLKPAHLPWHRLALLLGAGLPFAAVVVFGFERAPASDAGPLITAMLPLITAVASALFLKEKIARGRVVGLAMIGAGVVGVLLHGLSAGTTAGELMFLAGAVLWSCYAIAFRLSGLSAFEAAGIVAVWSCLLLLPFGGPRLIAVAEVAPMGELAGQLVVQGMVSGVASILAYTLAVRHLGPSRATAATAITPVVAGLVAIPVLGESIGLLSAVPLVVTTIGVMFASGAARVPFVDPAPARPAAASEPVAS